LRELKGGRPESLGYDATMNLPVVGVVAANWISYVIGPDGRILYSYADSNPVKHVENTLSFVKRWREEHN
jgi:thioredoxin-dependent peroxiredoxin